MTRQEYLNEVKEDVREFLSDNLNCYVGDVADMDELYDKVYDDLWIDDGVTGNASGSHTFNAYEAETNLAGAWDLLEEALTEFGYIDSNILEKGPEWCDVIIRCYLLSKALSEILEEMKEEIKEVILK